MSAGFSCSQQKVQLCIFRSLKIGPRLLITKRENVRLEKIGLNTKTNTVEYSVKKSDGVYISQTVRGIWAGKQLNVLVALRKMEWFTEHIYARFDSGPATRR